MKPTFIPNYWIDNPLVYKYLLEQVPWVNRGSPRDECFMAAENAPKIYSYGNNNEIRTSDHTYDAVPMHPLVNGIMDMLNEDFNTQYNVCVLNYYKDQHQHLGWHADDSPEQDLDHPIAVIAFGATREIWTKEKGFKGSIPEDNKYQMIPGALFIMPGGFQKNNLHRIPKYDKPCDGRISLTYRKLVK